MKKIISLSLLLGISGTGLLVVDPSFAQTVRVPIVGGVITVGNNARTGIVANFFNATLLTTLGTVTVDGNDGFNGTIIRLGIPTRISPVGGSRFTLRDTRFFTEPTSTLRFNGTTNGTGPTGALTNAPTSVTIIFSPPAIPTSFVQTTVTRGSITLPAPTVVLPPTVLPPGVVTPPVTPPGVVTPPSVILPPGITCTDCLVLPPDLIISNSAFLSPDLKEIEFRKKEKNDFSISSFRCSRILCQLDE